MSILNTYLQKEQQLKQLEEELDRLKNDERLKTEMDFKNHLENLMREFDKSAADVIKQLSPTQSADSNAKSTSSTKRKLKIYKNPNTGETVETRGGNQKTLKAWKEEYGAETVEGWLVMTKD
ncbi:DNA binding protein [Halomonas sediminis]